MSLSESAHLAEKQEAYERGRRHQRAEMIQLLKRCRDAVERLRDIEGGRNVETESVLGDLGREIGPF